MSSNFNPLNAGVIKNQPSNINFLIPHRFRLTIKRIPNVVYYCQEFTLPGISLGSAIQPTPFVEIPIYGDKLVFEDLSVTFPVDETLQNYCEIQKWLYGIGFPETYNQFAQLVVPTPTNPFAPGVHSDILLTILDNQENPEIYINFQNCYPSGLSQIVFDTKMTDAQVQTVTATFKYMLYDIWPNTDTTDTPVSVLGG